MRYEILAGACRDLEGSSGRLVLIGRLAGLVRETPDELLPMVALVCQGQLAPDVAGVELGVAARAAARLAGRVAVGDPGGRGGGPGAAPGRRGAGGAGSQGRKLAGLVGRLERATPLEGR